MMCVKGLALLRLVIFPFALLMLGNGVASAISLDFWGYVKKYKIGIERTMSSNDQMSAIYEPEYAPPENQADKYPGTKCVQSKITWKHQCETTLQQGGAASGWGVYLRQPFKRQGLFFFDYDFSLGVQSFQGELLDDRPTGTPLRTLSTQLYGLIPRFYLRMGITPQSWLPDLFISAGKQVHLVGGQVTLNGESAWSFMANRPEDSLYLEAEVVLVRPRKSGEFEIFMVFSDTGNNYLGLLYPKAVSGIREMHAKFQTYALGFRLLLP